MAGIAIIVILISPCIIETSPRVTSHHPSVCVTDAAAIQVLTAMNQNDKGGNTSKLYQVEYQLAVCGSCWSVNVYQTLTILTSEFSKQHKHMYRGTKRPHCHSLDS